MDMRVTLTKDAEAELEEIRVRDGILTPEAVVKYSRKKSAALHKYFLWDDDKEAARRFRLSQASHIIASVRVEQQLDEERKITVRLYHGTGEGGYQDIETVMNNDKWRDLLLARAAQDMTVFEAKYRNLEELAAVFRAMKKARKKTG